MNLRTFVTGQDVAPALGFDTAGSPGDGHIGARGLRPLMAVHELLGEDVATLAKTPADTAPQSEWPDLDLDAWEPHAHPLVIGLGPLAEQIVEQTPERVVVPADVGLYCTGAPNTGQSSDWLALRLTQCASALLLIDAGDPQSLVEARVWARRLAESEVYLRVVVALNAPAEGFDPEWRAALQAPLIEVRRCAHGEDAAGTLYALLPGVPFDEPNAMICYGFDDVRRVLSAGSRARTTAVRWTHPESPRQAIASACAALGSEHSCSALAWVNTGVDFTMEELEVLQHALDSSLAPTADLLLVPLLHRELPKSERVLSLTIVGD